MMAGNQAGSLLGNGLASCQLVIFEASLARNYLNGPCRIACNQYNHSYSRRGNILNPDMLVERSNA
jgi:hypothetical protein